MSDKGKRNEKIPAAVNRLPPPVLPANGQQLQPATHIAIPVAAAEAILAQLKSLSLINSVFQNSVPVTITPKISQVNT